MEMGYTAMYIKATSIYAVVILFSIHKIHEPRNHKVETGLPCLFVISTDPFGEFRVLIYASLEYVKLETLLPSVEYFYQRTQ